MGDGIRDGNSRRERESLKAGRYRSVSLLNIDVKTSITF